MSHGLYVLMDNGTVYDTTSIPITLYELFSIAGGSSGSKDYPQLAGMQVDCATMKQSTNAVENLSDLFITYDKGYPVVNWTPVRTGRAASTQTFIVFVR